MSKHPIVSTLFVLMLSLPGTVSAITFDQYTVTDLGSLDPGGPNDFSYPFDINDRGDIVGYSIGADGLDHAFVRLRGKALTDLGEGHATSINNSRQLAGYGGGPNYLTWQDDGTGNWAPQDIGIPLLNYAYRGQLIKINDRGHIVALGHDNILGSDYNMLWKDGVATNFAVNNSSCAPLSVIGFNNNDDALFLGTGGMNVFHGKTGQSEVLQANAPFAELSALNDAGDAVGLNKQTGGYGYYSETTGFKQAPTTQSLHDINNSGLAVGGGGYYSFGAPHVGTRFTLYYFTALKYPQYPGYANLAERAFVYYGKDDSLAYLDQLIPNSGWYFLIASAINDAGQIVGVGVNPAGQTHAFLLNPVGQP